MGALSRGCCVWARGLWGVPVLGLWASPSPSREGPCKWLSARVLARCDHTQGFGGLRVSGARVWPRRRRGHYPLQSRESGQAWRHPGRHTLGGLSGEAAEAGTLLVLVATGTDPPGHRLSLLICSFYAHRPHLKVALGVSGLVWGPQGLIAWRGREAEGGRPGRGLLGGEGALCTQVWPIPGVGC